MFLFTSNLEAGAILAELETGNAFADPVAVDAVCRNWIRAAGVAPELVGRIGCFLVFRPLSEQARVEIVTITIARVAEEYGLTVGYIAPSVVACILNQVRTDQFGTRPYEYLVDDLLGPAFVQAARAKIGSRVSVRGESSFECAALTEPVM